MKDSSYRSLLNLMRLAVVGVFLGRAWQHLFGEAPFRTILWDEKWMGWLAEDVLGYAWHDWVTSPAVDASVHQVVKGIGILYLLCVVAAIVLERFPRAARVVLYLGGFNLMFLAFLYTKENFYVAANFFEFSLQFSSPFFLVVLQRKGSIGRGFLNALKLATALTFTSYGLFALGVYPTPPFYGEIVWNTLGLGQAATILLLRTVGMLNILMSLFLFLPARWSVPALSYAVFLGIATAIVRALAYFDLDQIGAGLGQWLQEGLLQTPHFLVPLFLLLYIWDVSHQAMPPQSPDMKVDG